MAIDPTIDQNNDLKLNRSGDHSHFMIEYCSLTLDLFIDASPEDGKQACYDYI
jgi:hypothetical protein